MNNLTAIFLTILCIFLSRFICDFICFTIDKMEKSKKRYIKKGGLK